ncbi:MAG TPA: histidine phosphatase family protein [Rhizomicrobium sp.]|nr:histidine phosphatase family protein [Rhizomicrobium sp.]
MPRLYLVRHGRAAATFAEAADPGLDALGRSQAEAVATRLAPLGPFALVSSPLKRARETSEPLAARWRREPAIEPAVAEIPSPPGMGLAERAEWLRGFMAGSWRDASRDLAQWREEAVAALAALRDDTVIFSHFIAINVAAGAAERDDRVILFRPDNCSVTILDVENGALRLVERGHEAETKVN